jgi:D-inositol-3-phosphate glycosyltransferase
MAMRIAMISYHTCPLASEEGKESGGMNVYVLELARELASQGVHVDVFTRSVESHNIPVVCVSDLFRVVHIQAGPQESISKKQLQPYMPEFVRQVATFYEQDGSIPDIIHAHYYLSGLIARELKNMFESYPGIILSFHTLSLMKNLVARDAAEKEDSVRIQAEMQLCQSVDHIVATSESDKQYLEYLYQAPSDRVHVIPPGVNQTLFAPVDMLQAKKRIEVATDRQMILFVGRIEPLKGIDMLMYATKILSMRRPELSLALCIVGGDVSQPHTSWSKTLQSLNELRDTLHLSAIVQFVGQKTQEELVQYYNAASVVVMPSHYESFGMAALEAMSCGTPVIMTNAAGISGLIDDTHESLVTSVNNPLLLAHQIEQLLLDPVHSKEMGMEARGRVSDLSWMEIAKQMIALYTKHL